MTPASSSSPGSSSTSSPPTRIRREPPPFRAASVRRVEQVTPRLARVTLAGPELAGFAVGEPGASVRLLLPPSGTDEIVVPVWQGNEFRFADGSRPTIRTLTPWRADPDAGELDVGIVVHGGGRASAWVTGATPGDAAAVSGPGRGYTVDPDAPAYLVAGDETALPAIDQLLGVLPHDVPVAVFIEVAEPSARLPLGSHPKATIGWIDQVPDAVVGEALFAAVRGHALVDGTRLWVAGEAAAVQRIRRYLFTELGLPRRQATVRGYWKHGRAGDADDEVS